MDAVFDLFGWLFGAVRSLFIFFMIAIAIFAVWALYQSMCPACNKLRAAKFEKSTIDGGLIFSKKT